MAIGSSMREAARVTSSRTFADETIGRLLRRTLGWALLRTVALALALFLGALVTDQLGGRPAALVILGIVLPAGWLVAEVLTPRTVPVADGSELLVGRAAAADDVFAAIFRSLGEQHAVPATVHPRRVSVGKPVPGLRNVLRIRMGSYHATITVAPFGNDLHIGWRLTLRHVPLATLGRWLVALVAVDTGYIDIIEMEPARALTDVLRHAVQTGATTPSSEMFVTTFGADLPVEQADHRSTA